MNDKYTDKQVCDILGDNHFSNLLQYVLHMFGTMPRSMTEEEIIKYLKMNKNVGIIFKFMPEEVKTWCISHIKDLLYFDSYYKNFLSITSNANANICENDIVMDVVALSEDFKLKKEVEGKWVEFEIDKDGYFVFQLTNSNVPKFFFWWNWQKFLESSHKSDWNFISFGGWQYENDERWYLAPAVKLQDGKMWNSYVIEDVGEATPVIPVKIRFWREKK